MVVPKAGFDFERIGTIIIDAAFTGFVPESQWVGCRERLRLSETE